MHRLIGKKSVQRALTPFVWSCQHSHIAGTTHICYTKTCGNRCFDGIEANQSSHNSCAQHYINDNNNRKYKVCRCKEGNNLIKVCIAIQMSNISADVKFPETKLYQTDAVFSCFSGTISSTFAAATASIIYT